MKAHFGWHPIPETNINIPIHIISNLNLSSTCVARRHSATRVLKCAVAALLSSTQLLLITKVAPAGSVMSVARTGSNSISLA